jgi:hypothetical protein
MAFGWLLRYVLLSGLALALVTTLDDAAVRSEQARATEELLQGTWLREQAQQGTRARRLLVLDGGGVFREMVRVVDAAGVETEFVHEGTWLFDGTNLKRKYTLMNGQPPSRLNLPFATFQLSFDSRNEFHGVDHIHGNRIHYRRVAPETEP